ncbi:unnamed protein product [Boreogadus saida]
MACAVKPSGGVLEPADEAGGDASNVTIGLVSSRCKSSQGHGGTPSPRSRAPPLIGCRPAERSVFGDDAGGGCFPARPSLPSNSLRLAA